MSTMGRNVAVAGAALAVGAVVIKAYKPSKPKAYTPFPLPWFVKALFSLPNPVLRCLAQAPMTGLPDAESVFGKTSHTFEVINPNLMVVTYEFQPEPMMVQMSLAGLTPEAKQKLIDASPKEELELLHKDLEKLDRIMSIVPEAGRQGQYFKEGLRSKGQMIVARGRGNRLLLYNLVKVTPDVKSRLDAMGEVAFIVSPASAHTLFVKSGADAYPNAKVVASAGAKWKLEKAGVQVDYEYSTPEGMMEMNRDMAPDFEGFYLPDPVGHTLLILHHKTQTLLEADVMYMKSTEVPCSLENIQAPEQFLYRHFIRANIRPSPNGILPTYRFQGMDPEGGFPVAPKPEAWNKEATLRGMERVLSRREDYRTIRSAHFPGPITRAEFTQYLEAGWMKWLRDPRY